MASTTTIPEVSTTEGPEGNDGHVAESAATAEMGGIVVHKAR